MLRVLRLVSLLALALALSACGGWHLRGQGPAAATLEGRALYVDSRIGPEVYASVVRGLRLAGATVVEDPAAADAAVVLTAEDVQRRAAAVEPGERVQEYEVNYVLQFRLNGADGEAILPAQRVSSLGSYRVDRENVLSAQAREAQVVERLRQDAVRRLLPRVQAALREKQG